MKIINIDTGTVEQTRLSEQSGIALTRDTSYLTNLMNQEFLVEGISLVLVEIPQPDLSSGDATQSL